MPQSVAKPIKVLDGGTIDRIAAGEVIERPASVVKELIENALDAGARHLKITLQDGGLASISCEDDGFGIPFRELPLAFERHATSKIATAVDILQVATFGFRGEALASIASVGRCRLVSRTEDEDVGGMIVLEAGKITLREPAPRNRGTTVIVEDLFFNTPARRKYLGTAAAEKRAVLGVVTTYGLAYPEVRWVLREGQDTLLELSPAADLPSRARDILGSHVSAHLARFAQEEGGLAVSGLASRPTWTRGNRSQQFLFANRRPIHSAALSQAVAMAFREVIPPGRHPVVILFLQVPVGEIDVNVHPAKTEVRLLLERRAFSLVRSALQDGLNLRRAAGSDGATVLTPDGGSGSPAPDQALSQLAQAQQDYLQRHFRRAQAAGEAAEPPEAAQGSLFGHGPRRRGSWDEPALQPAPFWQLHRTYILTQIHGALVIIDQHNSHERILFNEASRALAQGGGNVPTQQLLFPANLDLTPVQLQTFHDRRDDLVALGFLIQPFGGQSILVQGIPAAVKNWADGRLLLDILDDLAAGGPGRNENRQDLLASYACHAAVRAGELLTLPEMQQLVDQLFATDLPLSCPHGRPTVIQFSLEDLQKRFGRR